MKKGLLLTTCLAALLGVGVFAGVSAGKEAKVEKAEAANTDGTISIYFTRPNSEGNNWGDNGIRIHTWDEGGSGTTWGTAWLMTWVYNNEYGQGVFAWHSSASEPLYSNIIFHNDDNGKQTATLNAPTVSTHYYYDGNTLKTMAPQTQRIYLYDYDNRFENGDVKIHSWINGKDSVTTAWPGISMSVTDESAGNGRVYYADVYHKYDRVIFNVGGDANKTGIIEGMYDNGCYVLANNDTVLSGKNTWWDNINYVWAHNFNQNLMNFRNVSKEAGANRDSDGCKSFYENAKTGYTAIRANSYAYAKLLESFPDAIERLEDWATANNEVFDTSEGTFTPINQRGNFGFGVESASSNGATAAIIVAVSAVIAGAGFFFFKKKRLSK